RSSTGSDGVSAASRASPTEPRWRSPSNRPTCVPSVAWAYPFPAMRGCRGLSFAATAILLAGVPAAARGLAGADPLAVLPEPHCYNATQPNADYEAYGPTDVSVQAGDGRVTVGENPDG